MNNLIDLSRAIPTPQAGLTLAFTPIVLHMAGRPALEMRITAPAKGENLPILLLSHGAGPSKYVPSKDGYAPLAQFWAERGFAVIQPTHDDPHFTDRSPKWHADAFFDSPGAQALVTVQGIGHGLGGIAGLDAKETEIEVPDSLEATRRLSLARLLSALRLDLGAWLAAAKSLDGPVGALAHVTPVETTQTL